MKRPIIAYLISLQKSLDIGFSLHLHDFVIEAIPLAIGISCVTQIVTVIDRSRMHQNSLQFVPNGPMKRGAQKQRCFERGMKTRALEGNGVEIEPFFVDEQDGGKSANRLAFLDTDFGRTTRAEIVFLLPP